MTSRRTRDILQTIYRRMVDHFGPLGWWPGDGPLEILVGVVLTQNTAWTNVEKAIANLNRAGVMSPEALLGLPVGELIELIRPSGYYNLKARRLRSVVQWFVDAGGSFEALARRPMEPLRRELLGVHGLGPESVDCILLYVLGKPSFVVDAYTRRIFSRHGLCRDDAPYDELKALFEDHLPSEVDLFNEYHAQIVYTGKTFCKPTPRCPGCPLNGLTGRCGGPSGGNVRRGARR